MGAAPAGSPGAFWARLKHAIDVDVDLLVEEGNASLDLGALELRRPIPPDDVGHKIARRQMDAVVACSSLSCSHTSVTRKRPAGIERERSLEPHLVGTLRGELGGDKEVEFAVGLRDVVPHGKTRLEEQTRSCGVSDLYPIDLDANMS